jgi:hypothetical protein
MKIKYNRFALIPTTCSCCGKAFWLEPYKRLSYEKLGISGIVTFITDICKECIDKPKDGEDGEK